MKLRNLKRGEVAATLLLGAVASGVVVSYGLKEVGGPQMTSFAKQWIKDPVVIGACTPSSKYVVEEIMRPLNSVHKPLRVLEVGAGNGVCTHAITDHLKRKKFTLDAIEINPQFCQKLKKDFQSNPCVTVYQADITKWKPTEKYDVIISTLPLNLLDIHITQQVLILFEQWMAPGGRLSYVEGAGSSTLPKIFMSVEARKLFDEKYKCISEFKKAHLDKTVTVLRNIPPYHVHHLKF
jgi:phospholipid N-methyltransferase